MSARVEARQAVLFVEVENGNAILRSATELKPQEAIRMPIPYRQHCAYALANGKIFLPLQKLLATQLCQLESKPCGARDVRKDKIFNS